MVFVTDDAFTIMLTDPQGEAARAALQAYYGELSETFPEGFDVTASNDPASEELTMPNGGFFVAIDGEGEVAGCVGIKAGQDYGEIKRLWIAPRHRGRGVARMLMDNAEGHARRLGLSRLRLDTNRALPDAIAMYRGWGWHEIDRFNDDPYAQIFFEKRL